MSWNEDRPSGNRTLRIVLAVLGGVTALGLLLCCGLIFSVYRTVTPAIQEGMQVLENTVQSQTAAHAFLEDLRSNRLDEAYQATTEPFRTHLSRQALEELLRRHPALQQAGPIDEGSINLSSVEDLHTRNYVYRVPASKGKTLEVRLRVVKEGTAFLVDDLTMEEVATPSPATTQRDTKPAASSADKGGTATDRSGAP